MSHSTEFRNGIAQPATAEGQRSLPEAAWARVKLIVTRAVFWSYERGSWHYDIICAVILAFIFLTPRAWFQDRPTLQMSDLRHVQGVVEIGHGKNWQSFELDSRLVESLAPAQPKDAAREILERRMKKPFTMKSFEPIRDKNNVTLGYTVVVEQ